MDYHGLAGKVKDFKTRQFQSAHLLGIMLIAVVSLLLAYQFTSFSTRLSTALVGIRPTYRAEIFNGREGMEQATAGDQKGQSLVEYALTHLLVLPTCGTPAPRRSGGGFPPRPAFRPAGRTGNRTGRNGRAGGRSSAGRQWSPPWRRPSRSGGRSRW